MTDQEWLAYRDRLAALTQPTGAQIADTLSALLERLNTIIISYANREHDDVQGLAREITALRATVDDLRALLDRPREREAGDGNV